MPRSSSLLLSSLLLGAVLFSTPVCGEDSAPATPKPATVEDDAKKKLASLDAQLRKGPLTEAIAALDAAIAAEPDNESLPARRSVIVRRLTLEKQSEAAVEQGTKLLEFHQSGLDRPGGAIGLFMAAQDLVVNYDRLGQKDKGTAVLEAGLRQVAEIAPEGRAVSTQVNANTLFLRAKGMRLADLQGYAAADAFLADECRRIDIAGAAEPDRMVLLQTWSRLMEVRIDVADSAEKNEESQRLASELETTFLDALKSDDKSVPHLRELLRIRTREVGRIARDEPEAALELFNKTLAFVEDSPLKEEPVIQQNVKSFKALESRIESSLTLKKLVGLPAPPFDIQTWAHGDPLPADALKGKIALVDFWAIWCGPCIATFPHLVELHEKYHDKGLEIVGVTREYGYSWNEAEQRAESDKEDATLESEVAMLDKFMAHHKLHHATIVTPKSSPMYKAYGVSGIPHVVLIDRHGVIRLIKVGSGEANAKAIHDMIEKLLSE